jgi:hypothetical protein
LLLSPYEHLRKPKRRKLKPKETEETNNVDSESNNVHSTTNDENKDTATPRTSSNGKSQMDKMEVDVVEQGQTSNGTQQSKQENQNAPGGEREEVQIKGSVDDLQQDKKEDGKV